MNKITEKQIQNYIWGKKERFADLLSQPYFPEYTIDNPTYVSPSQVLYNLVINRYKELWESIKELNLFGCEVSLTEEGKSTMRTDFLAIRDGYDGIVVVELKKSDQTARQAYTELLAYGSYLKTKIAPMSGADIIYLLISPIGERIVEQATINSLIYDNKDVCLLIPKWENDDINTLKLELWIPEYSIFENLSYSCFNMHNISVSKITWESLPGEWSPNPGEQPTAEMYKQLNKVSSIAAQIMEERNIHGFVYCAQLIPDFANTGIDMNSIILAGINPYKVIRERIFNDKSASHDRRKKSTIDEIDLADIIPSLKSQKDISYKYIFEELEMVWTNKLDKIGFEIPNVLTQTFERNYVSKEHGDFTWDSLLANDEDYLSDNLDIHLTGIFRKLFFEYARLDYTYIRTHTEEELENFPVYQEGGIPFDFIEMVNSQTYVRLFINRLANPFLLSQLELEDIKTLRSKGTIQDFV